MKKYTVRTSCEVAGVWREAGSEIDLTDEQARELAPPFGRVVMGATNRALVTGDTHGGLDGTKRVHRRRTK